MTAGQHVCAYMDRLEELCREAYQYVDYLGIEGPRDDESGTQFRERISGELRERGMVIEAHEALRGRRWDAPDDPGLGDPGSVLTGIAGHVAITMQRGEPYSRDGVSQMGDELAAGFLATNRDPARDAMGALIDALGPRAALDVMDAFRGS